MGRGGTGKSPAHANVTPNASINEPEAAPEAAVPHLNSTLRTALVSDGSSSSELPLRATRASLFGQKTIGGFGAVVLVANNVTGPGMLALPALFQKAGWLPTTVATIFIGAVSSAAACFFVDSIGLLPNNKTFNRRIEFCEPYRFHFGFRWELIMHVAFYLTLLCQNVASIVEVSQVMDSVLAWAFSETYALELMPRFRMR